MCEPKARPAKASLFVRTAAGLENPIVVVCLPGAFVAVGYMANTARQGYRALQEMSAGFVMSKTYSTFNAFAEFVQAIANFYSTFRKYMPEAKESCLHPSPSLLRSGAVLGFFI